MIRKDKIINEKDKEKRKFKNEKNTPAPSERGVVTKQKNRQPTYIYTSFNYT